MDEHAWPDKATPLLLSAWSMALSAMTIEYELFIYIHVPLVLFKRYLKCTVDQELFALGKVHVYIFAVGKFNT